MWPWGDRQESGWLVGELTVLLAILIAVGVVIVPCHWTSTWGDREFTGWVVPIANRLAGGQLLYTDGGHLPLPPLPYVLASVLFGSHGIWFSESVLNFTFQCLAILVLYLGMSLYVPRPVPFLAALATMPIFFSLAKTIAYDAITQAFVSLVAVTTAVYTSSWSAAARDTDSPGRLPSRSRRLAALAAATAACILAKQSTGAGAALGACCAVTLYPSVDSLPHRIRCAAAYVAATTVALLLGCVALSPFMSVSGFLTDVVLTGSEPKGGLPNLMNQLAERVAEIGTLCTPTTLTVALILAVLGLSARGFLHGQLVGNTSGAESGDHPEAALGSLLPVSGAALLGVAVGLFALASFRQPIPVFLSFSPFVGFLPADLLSTGLLLCIVIMVLEGLAPILPDGLRVVDIQPLVILSLVLFPAAMFHTLSVGDFRWTYDNNPLIMAALAVVLLLSMRALRRLLPRARVPFAILMAAGAFALEFGMWTTLGPTLERVRMSTDTWPEVPYLKGARLTRDAAGMREVVDVVRRLAPDPADKVLLLPDDPNVESWFERPRPALSGAIVFVDQYWDRFVDTDFGRLEKDPPKVIVIGPRYWGRFLQLSWGHGNTGAARLIERVDRELLPRYYRLRAEQKIKLNVREDFMDVYVRADWAQKGQPH